LHGGNRKRKRAPKEPSADSCADAALDQRHVLGLQTFGSLLDLELHLRAFVQRAVAVGLDRGKVNEHVVAAGSLIKSLALGGVKPFHSAFFLHLQIS